MSPASLGLLLAGIVRGPAAQEGPAPGERERVEAALPDRAFAPPLVPRRLLIFDLNVGYGGHPSRFTANLAFEGMERKTGAFETTVSRDPAIFSPERLRKFDAVFLNNTVGNLFEDPALRRGLVEFVAAGGGLMGVHGTSVAFVRWKEGGREDWPEFGVLLGGRGANHRAADEHVFVKLDDPGHPLNRPFGGRGFEYRSEFFRVHEPYSRRRVRVLFSIDTARTDMNQGPSYGRIRRDDEDYALAWVRSYGRGRVFYCTIGHAPSVFWDPLLLKFYLAAAQFALGDLPAPTAPSAFLTPAHRARERLGWRLGLEAHGPLFEAVDRASELGLPFVGALVSRDVGAGISARLGPGLEEDILREIRMRLGLAGVRLLACDCPSVPADPEGLRRLFEFGRRLGVELFRAAPPAEALDVVGKLCDEFDIRLALPGGDPDRVLEACRGRSPRIGAWADAEEWERKGVDPARAVPALGERLMAVRLGGGEGRAERLVREIHRAGIRPLWFGIGGGTGPGGADRIARDVAFFDRISLELAPRGEP